MKRLIITAIFLLTTTGAVAEFFGSGEFGYSPETGDFHTILEIGYRFRPWVLTIDLYGGFEVLMEKYKSILFNPYRDIYTAGGCVQWERIYFSIEHTCVHSVYSGEKQFEKHFIGADSRTRFGIGFQF